VDKEISFDTLDTSRRGAKINLQTIVVSVDINVNQVQSSVSGSIQLKGTLYNTRRNNNGPEIQVIFDSEEHLTEESYYAMDMVGFEKGENQGYGYPNWPGGREAATVRLLLQSVDDESRIFRRVGVGIYDNVSKMKSDAWNMSQLLEGLEVWPSNPSKSTQRAGVNATMPYLLGGKTA
jgi:hypothetical protein